MIFTFKGNQYPAVLERGNAAQFIVPMAKHFCVGKGYDVGCGKYPLEGSIPIDKRWGKDAMQLPEGRVDYVFSSHCLEHLPQPVEALRHWQTRLKPGGVLFLYLPHPDAEMWWPENNRSHLNLWTPMQVVEMFKDLGLVNVLSSERDIAWGFAVIGFAP